MTDEVAELPGEPENTGEDVTEESSPQPEDTSAEQPEEPKKAKGVQKRIDELTANWREEQRRSEQLQQQLFQLQQQAFQKPPEQPPAPPQPQGEPKLDDYASYDEYVGALADYRAEQKLQAWQEQQTQAQQQTQAEQARAQFMSRAEQFAQDVPDFNTVAFNPNLPVSEAMAEVLNASEQGPQVLYHLGKNPAEAMRIAQLSPVQAALEMGRLEASLVASQPQRQTSAPDPIQPIEGGGGKQGIDPETMSTTEWLEWRNNQLRS